MKVTNNDNILVSEIIAHALNISFHNKEFRLSKWGDVDNYCELSTNSYILLECENGQKHPNTNVLKLYPYLEDNNNINIVLLHYFFSKNKAPQNRLDLCDFIAGKIAIQFPERFQYLKLPSQFDEIPNYLKKHKNGLMQNLLTGQVNV